MPFHHEKILSGKKIGYTLFQKHSAQQCNEQDQQHQQEDPQEVLPARLIDTGQGNIQIVPAVRTLNENPPDDHPFENQGIPQAKLLRSTGMSLISGARPLKCIDVSLLLDQGYCRNHIAFFEKANIPKKPVYIKSLILCPGLFIPLGLQ